MLEVVTILFAVSFVVIGYATRLGFAAPLAFALVIAVFAHADGQVARALRGRLMQNLGLWSYSIYMVHASVFIIGSLVVKVMYGLAAKVGSTTVLAAWSSLGRQALLGDVVAIGYVVVVVGLASVTYRVVELPGQRVFAALAARVATRS